MFARVVVCQSKAGQSGQVGTKLEEDVLPIAEATRLCRLPYAFRQVRTRETGLRQFLDFASRCRNI
jgi:hypothetical protein